MDIPEINVFTAKDFHDWLKRHHATEDKVRLVIHKKHTGKGFPTHRELLNEAICFGWIDTTIKRLDEDTFVRNFSKRNEASTWSDNTLSYAKQLMKEGRMRPQGMHFYEKGKKKPTHDHGIPKNPDMPTELKKALAKEPESKKNFEKVAPSMKRAVYRYILRAVLPVTRAKRVAQVVANSRKAKKDFFRSTNNT